MDLSSFAGPFVPEVDPPRRDPPDLPARRGRGASQRVVEHRRRNGDRPRAPLGPGRPRLRPALRARHDPGGTGRPAPRPRGGSPLPRHLARPPLPGDLPPLGPPRDPRVSEPTVPGAGSPDLLRPPPPRHARDAPGGGRLRPDLPPARDRGHQHHDLPPRRLPSSRGSVDGGGDEVLHHRGALHRPLVLRRLAPVRRLRHHQPVPHPGGRRRDRLPRSWSSWATAS